MMRKLLALLSFLASAPALHAQCRDLTFDGASFTACDVRAGDDLRVFLADAGGRHYGSFAAVEGDLAAQGQRLAFAMNAGMYHPDRLPVGLYVENGVEAAPIVTADGPGNFGLLPNGVFCVAQDGGFRVTESRRFGRQRPDCRHATQSGPMLVIGGDLHPRFLPRSDSLYLRNGVGVSADGQRATFVISNDAVNFHHFARLFQDELGLPDALYFDGKISRLYAPAIRRNDLGFAMGPIIGLVVPAAP